MLSNQRTNPLIMSATTSRTSAAPAPDAYKKAENRTAHHANRDLVLIGHKTRTGELVTERQSVASVRRALLAVGTKGSIRQFVGGHRLIIRWRAGINLFYQLKYPGDAPGPALLSERPAEYRRATR